VDPRAVDGPWTLGVDEDRQGVSSIYRINTGLLSAGPGSRYSTAALIRMTFEDVGENGMPTPAASSSLSDLSDRIEAALKKHEDSVFVGQFTTAQVGRTFCFYTTNLDGLNEAFGRSIAPYRAKCDDVKTGTDPDWKVYRDLVDHAQAGADDIELVRKTELLGVDPEGVHDVEHFLYFPSEEAANRAVSEAFSAVESEGPHQAESGEWTVVVPLQHTLQLTDLAHNRCVLRDVGSRFGGTYDGWGTAIEDGPR
jgi:regulator of RNase E activity RraB